MKLSTSSCSDRPLTALRARNSNTSVGTLCGLTAADCPHNHHRNDSDADPQSNATTDTATDPASNADEADTVAVVDGGDVGTAVEHALDSTNGERPLVIVVTA